MATFAVTRVTQKVVEAILAAAETQRILQPVESHWKKGGENENSERLSGCGEGCSPSRC